MMELWICNEDASLQSANYMLIFYFGNDPDAVNLLGSVQR